MHIGAESLCKLDQLIIFFIEPAVEVTIQILYTFQ